jgi:endonuclease YncB( thermonuclease family)
MPALLSVRLTLWAVLVLLATLCAVNTADFSINVVGISDGDTITVLIDRSPVSSSPLKYRLSRDWAGFGQPRQGCDVRAWFAKVVTIRQHGRDRYGRIVADVILADGRNVNHELVRRGLARWYRKYAPHAPVLS